MSSLYTEGTTYAPDRDQAEYLLWSGAFPGGNGGMQEVSKAFKPRLLDGSLKIDVIDPTLANGMVTATMPGINWIPIKPATNGAFYSAVAQYMIKNKTYNEEFLSFPNQAAAVDGGYGACSNASHLVIVDENHPNYKKIMRPADAGIEDPEEKDSKGAKIAQYVCIDAATGEPALHTKCAKADLYFEGEVNGVKVRTGFLMLTDSVNAYTIEEYSEITGISVEEIERMAKEFGSHGVKVSVNAAAGSTAGTNGFDTPAGREVLKALVGSNGMCGGSYSISGSPVAEGKGARYDIATNKTAGVTAENATQIARCGHAWKDTDEYKNRVAAGEKDPKPMLPWYPMAKQSDSQALISAVNQYPYQCKIMMTWMCNVIQATPGSMRDEVIERLKNPEIVPLHIACDIVIGEMAQYADYIVPDVSQFESFGLPGGTQYGCAVRYEGVTPPTPELADGSHVCWESLLIDVAHACDLPGWGDDAFTDVDGNTWPFNNAFDYYVKAIANVAYAEGDPVADIDPEEAHMQGLDELNELFQKAVTAEEWPKVQHVMSRGGRFWTQEERPMRGKDGRAAKPMAKSCMTYIYNEKRATVKNDYSGETYPGGLSYNPQHYSDMSLVTDLYSIEEYPFTASEHKPRFRSITRLAESPVMRDLCSHNYIEINDEDAAALGIKDGDQVRVLTPAGDVTEGEAMVRAGQVKGAFSVAFGYGHKNYGAQDIEIDGKLTKGDPEIAAGCRLNTMLDPILTKDGTLMIWADNSAASPGRCGGIYKIEKA